MKPAETANPLTPAIAAPLEPVVSSNGNTFPVVGFGASAGGLEAFSRVLNHLSPSTGMAIVLVQHLDPNRESMLAEILSRATSMPVIEVRRSIPVEPNNVYVAPRGMDMRIQNRVLHLSPYPATREPHMPINYFLSSLADDLRNNAIGVILSGTGSDGSQGLKAIKAEGGITFAQDEKSAKFDGMLRSAIAGGCVDFILPPEKIAEELARLGSHPYVAPPLPAPPEEVIPLPDDALAQILRRIHAITDVDLSLYKPNTIKRRILRRMLLSKAPSLDDYMKRLQSETAEVQALYEDMLINVTQFFRDPETFQVLKTQIFPRIAGEGSGGVRVWVPGCSTGEEVYSLAISLLEYLEEREHQVHIQLFGTEISEQALERARTGLYSEAIAADVTRERLKRFFLKIERGYQISKRIRDCCIFARQNLTRDPPFSKLDLISCRNVLIYLGPELQKKVLPIFHYALKPTGFLLLGSSETIGAYAEMFSPVDKKHKIFARRTAASTRLPLGFVYGGPALESKIEHHAKGALTMAPADLQREADRLVLARFGPAGVIINEYLEVIQFRGQTGPYLEPPPGPASYHILKMAREGLLTDLRSAINRAMSGDLTVRHEGIRIKHNGDYRDFDLEVIPLKRAPEGGRFFLVLFRPRLMGAATKNKPPKLARRGKQSSADEIRSLREDLAATRERLQGIIEEQEAANEELRSANEEIQSSNEELQSTNEELETAKEELQSSNEELNTVNEELENRNVQLAQVNDDMRNLLSSVNIPIVMVSSDLRLRRFTPQAEKIFSIIASDVGRPIGNIRPHINISNLEQLLTEAIETLRTHETEVQDANGRWHLLRIRPYRTEDNRIEGAVLVLVDIDAMRRTSEDVRLARDFSQSIIETTRSSLLVLDAERRAKLANPAFYQMFQLTPDEVLGRSVYDIAGGYWTFPALRSLLEDLTPGNGRLDDYAVEHDFPRVGRKSLVLNARFLRGGSSDPEQLVLLAIDDTSGRKPSTAAAE